MDYSVYARSQSEPALFVSRISVYTCMLQPIGIQSSDKYVHHYYGDGVAQGFVNKLTALVALF